MVVKRIGEIGEIGGGVVGLLLGGGGVEARTLAFRRNYNKARLRSP